MKTTGNFRKSKQRERILALLNSTDSHPTAGWLYDHLKNEFKNLSMGTVYRNLSILVEQGLIKKIDFGSTFDRFDGNIQPHYHFICECCGAVIDLDMAVEEELNRKAGALSGFLVKWHRAEFFGKCDRCRY